MFGKKRKISPEHGSRNALIIGGIVLLVAAGLRVKTHFFPPEPPKALVVLNSASFTTEIAATPERRERGLGGREELPYRHAMYFPFPSEGRWVFWMKDMRFPIDIIWIRDGRVVDVAERAAVPKGGKIDRYAPDEPANAVLEVNAGVAEELNVKDGDVVRLINDGGVDKDKAP